MVNGANHQLGGQATFLLSVARIYLLEDGEEYGETVKKSVF